MKKHIILTTIAMWLVTIATMAQGGLLVTGIVKDKETRQALANVNISVQGTNIGTVTNAWRVSLSFTIPVTKRPP